MKFLKIALLVLLVTGCANTDDVDDSDVTNDTSASSSSDDESGNDGFDELDQAAPTPAPAKSTPKPSAPVASKDAYSAQGEASGLLYNIASSALKKSDATLSYSVKCTYGIKPMSIKSCRVKSGFLPEDAKNKVGKLLLDAKNLPRKKSGMNEATVTTNYTCQKSKNIADTVCNLERAP